MTSPRAFHELRRANRIKLVDGDDREILPGVRVYTGGRHTFASQYVGVRTRAGTVVLASDNAYLYENLEGKLAIAQTLDADVEPRGAGADAHARGEARRSSSPVMIRLSSAGFLR